jgi:hypothetical protein
MGLDKDRCYKTLENRGRIIISFLDNPNTNYDDSLQQECVNANIRFLILKE